MSAPYSNPDGRIIPRAEIVPGLFQDEGMSAQIHGGLRIHNIDKVVFMNSKELPSSRLIELLNQHQIKYEFITEETISQEIAQKQIEVLWKAYNNEIARQECEARGENLSKTMQNKSSERLNKGMTKELIDLSLSAFYKLSVDQLEPKEAQNLAEKLDISLEDTRDYVLAQAKPKTLDNPKAYESAATYRIYINPIKGDIIISAIYREDDQHWRDKNPSTEQEVENFQKNLGLKTIPEDFLNLLKNQERLKDFLKRLYTSDVLAELYQRARKKHKELSKDNVSYSPVTRVIIYEATELKTLKALSEYAKDGKPSSKGDETFSTTIGTPLGQITPYMLFQNPEKVGDGKTREVTHTGLLQKGDILRITLDIGEKKT